MEKINQAYVIMMPEALCQSQWPGKASMRRKGCLRAGGMTQRLKPLVALPEDGVEVPAFT